MGLLRARVDRGDRRQEPQGWSAPNVAKALVKRVQPSGAMIKAFVGRLRDLGARGTTAGNSVLQEIEDLGFSEVPVCMAKTQYSLTDDQTKLGRPNGFTINVREVYVSAGAGFVVAVTGSIMTMPGLSKNPAAYGIDVNDDGVITGLF